MSNPKDPTADRGMESGASSALLNTEFGIGIIEDGKKKTDQAQIQAQQKTTRSSFMGSAAQKLGVFDNNNGKGVAGQRREPTGPVATAGVAGFAAECRRSSSISDAAQEHFGDTSSS